MVEQAKFGPIRRIFWPIHRLEIRQVVVKFLLLFLVCCCYSVLRNLKDAVILQSSGTEVIPFIKVWGMVPGAIIAMWLYARLRNRVRRELVFYTLISAFLIYFLVFAFIIYPRHESLRLNELSVYLSSHLPTGFKGMIAMICNWSVSLFYIISELWASVILTVLCWGFINDMTKVSQGKRFYGILNLGSNIAPLVGIFFATLFERFFPFHFAIFAGDPWKERLATSILFISICGLLAMLCFHWLMTIRNRLAIAEDEVIQKKPKMRLSMRESIKFIMRNKYLASLAMIVLGYNIAINFTDILWKCQLKTFFSDPSDILSHMNKVSMGIGTISTICAILFSFLVSRMGWTFTAILTPLVMAGLAIIFFLFLFAGNSLAGISTSIFGITPLALTVYLGSMQNCLSKAGKYSIFDATKELAFLNVDEEVRVKGKAAIDGLGSGIGKSGSSLTYQGFLILFGSLSSCTPYIAVLLLFVFFGWFYSVRTIGQTFKKEPQLQTA